MVLLRLSRCCVGRLVLRVVGRRGDGPPGCEGQCGCGAAHRSAQGHVRDGEPTGVALRRPGLLGALAVLFLVMFFVGEDEEGDDEEPAPVAPLVGAFPVPAMPAGGPVRGAAAPLTFDSNRSTVSASASAESGEEN